MESKFKARCGEELGHEVDLIDFWNDYNWNSFDVVIVLQFGGMFRTMVPLIRKLAKKLVLAGFLNGEIEQKWLNDLMNESENIKYVGTLTNEELLQYYQRAKVFALPSIMEGVGMVALEAASNGCEIVLTDKGAPKDYFQGQAYLVSTDCLCIDSHCDEYLFSSGK